MNLTERLAQASGAKPANGTARRAAAPRGDSAGAASPSPRRTDGATPLRARPDRPRKVAGANELDELRTTVRAAVIDELGPGLAAKGVDEARVRHLLEKRLEEALRSSSVTVPPSQSGQFLDSLVADMLGWGPLTQLMEDASVTEIMCNSLDEIWVEKAGRIELTDVRFASADAYRLVIDRMLAVAGRRVDEAAPMADGRLPDGSRVNAIIPPLVVGGPVLTIRRFPEQALTVTSLIACESLSTDAALFLEAAVRGKLNVVVSGGTGTGKTTLLNVLSSFIPDGERVITIEDAAELRLAQRHVVTLEARPANIEGAGQIAIRDLVRNALRMRPDRIVVGEVRGGEAIDMLQAMNTGHEGSMTTVHANTPRDALSRIETMVLMSGVELPLRAIREQLASAIDVIVQLQRRTDGSRVVSSVVEIQGREGDTITLQDVFARTPTGPLHATGLRPRCAETLRERGVTLAPSLFRGHLDTSLGRKKQ
ncbi:MAG TPA: CpaF family protein [Acidimicrobiales bacterium]|nr:CpaF family protein [Acidimicrobiales bacterium]